MARRRRRATARQEQAGPDTHDIDDGVVGAITIAVVHATQLDPHDVVMVDGPAVLAAAGRGAYAVAVERTAGGEPMHFVARVGTTDAIAREAAVLAHLRSAGFPVLDVLAILPGESAVLVVEPPPHPALIEAMTSHLTTIPQFVAEFGAAHARLHAVAVGDLAATISTPEPLDRLRVDVEAAGLADELADALRWLAEHRAEKSERTVVVHGDYNPVNVLVDPPAPQPVAVLNWARGGLGEPSFDVARATATLWSAPYFATKFTERTMVKLLRDSLIEAYRKAYDAAAVEPLATDRLHYWDVYQTVSSIALAARAGRGVTDPWDPAGSLVDATGAAEDGRNRLSELLG